MKNGLRLCFSTLPCPQCGTRELAALCGKYGIDGVEVRLEGDDVPPIGEGVNVVDVGTGVCLLNYDESGIASAKKILRQIEGTKIRAIRIFLGNFAVMKTDAKVQVSYDGIVRALRELCGATKKEIWIETHNEFATGRVLKRLTDDVGRDNIRILWDVIHPIEDGEAPEETWAYIGDRIAHVHLKDGRRSDDPLKHDYDYTPLGKGTLPLHEVLNLLVREKFDGYVSLEWENRWRAELAAYSSDIDDILADFRLFMDAWNG